MRLVEVNGAGWCLQLVSNRRGPGHLIICLFIARRRTNRSCRNEAQAENTAQRSHTRQEQPRARLCAGGRGPEGKGCLGRCRARPYTLAPPGDPPRSCSRLLPAPSPCSTLPAVPWGQGGSLSAGGRCAAQPGPSSARSLALSPLPGCSRAAGAGEGAAAGCWGPARRAEARACCLVGFPLQAQGLSSGTRFSWLLGLCVGTKGRQQRGCALHSVTTGRGGERRYLCALKMKFPASV